MAKGTRYKTKLESTAGTGYFYTKTSGSLIGKEIKKYDPKVRKHVYHKGVKLK